MTGVRSFFFFSSRRRHTRLVRDWSSDVCSSDLAMLQAQIEEMAEVDESQFLTSYVSPDDEEQGLPEMEGLDTATVAEVAPVAAAAITPVAESDVEEPDAVAAAPEVEAPAVEPVAEVVEPEALVEPEPEAEAAAEESSEEQSGE